MMPPPDEARILEELYEFKQGNRGWEQFQLDLFYYWKIHQNPEKEKTDSLLSHLTGNTIEEIITKD